MSDKYRPPTGPKSTRSSKDDRRRPFNSNNNNAPRGARAFKSYNGRDSFVPQGPRRYPDRDGYGPNSSQSSHNHNEINKNTGYRPTGPSGYRKNDEDYNYGPGAKRSFPSEPKGYRGDGYRKRQDRRDNKSFHSMKEKKSINDSKFEEAKKDKLDLKTIPKGPRMKDSSIVQRKESSNKVPIKRPNNSQIYQISVVRRSDTYKKVHQVGKGTYGKVYKAKNTILDEYVAMKKLRLEKEREGFPITAMREIKLLQAFDHQNVVSLLEMMIEYNSIYMILDYMDHDLKGILTHPTLKLSEGHRKNIFKQLMHGLEYLHSKRVIHRDIKSSNILLNNEGVLKITDFGLARTMNTLIEGEVPDYTNRVITIWYRPPELLLGSTDYGREVDVWGVGCLLIELYSKAAAFQGFDEIGQLHKIFNIMGTPSISDWPEMENLPWFEMLKPRINKSSEFARLYKDIMSEQSFNLALKLLRMNPKTRLTAKQALEDDYFTKSPPIEPLTFLKEIKGEWHEFESKKWRMERKLLQEYNANSSLPQSQSLTQTAPEAEEFNPESLSPNERKA